MSTEDQTKTPITGDDLYAQELAQTKANIGDDIPEHHLEFLRERADDPAILLAHNTTACPSWCDGRHDSSGPNVAHAGIRRYVIHSGPQLLEVSYNGSPNPAASGWGVQLVAYEYAEKPGQLEYMLDVFGEPDGLHEGSVQWNFDLPPSWLRHLASIAGRVDELLGGAE